MKDNFLGGLALPFCSSKPFGLTLFKLPKHTYHRSNYGIREVWTHFTPDYASVFLSSSRSSQENKTSKFLYKFYKIEIFSIHLSFILAIKFVTDCECSTKLHSSWRKRGACDFAKWRILQRYAVPFTGEGADEDRVCYGVYAHSAKEFTTRASDELKKLPPILYTIRLIESFQERYELISETWRAFDL